MPDSPGARPQIWFAPRLKSLPEGFTKLRILSYQGTNRIDFSPSLLVSVPDLRSNATGGNGGFEALSATFDHLDPLFPSSAAKPCGMAQVRRISWVRRVR